MKLKHIGILLFSTLYCCFIAESQPVNIEHYSFLNTKSDSVIFYGQSQKQFKLFVEKFIQMIRLGKSQVKILHLGDSHLQADLYTGQVRKNFQSFMTGLEGARGMITPFVKASPDSYKIIFSSSWKSINILSQTNNANLGLWGTTAYTTSTNNTIDININNKNPIKYDFNRLKVYHSDLNNGDNIIISGLEVAYQKIYNRKEGYTEFVLADYVKDVKIVITKNNSETFYLYGLYFDNDDAGVVYNVSGTNGATANSYLNAQRLMSDIAKINPDMIIISLGTNDTYEQGGENTFEGNLSSLVAKIKNSTTNIPILLITPVECHWHKKKINPRQEKTVEIIENVAKSEGCLYLNMYNILGGKGSSNNLVNNALMQRDKVHLTTKGYQLEGDLLYNALWNAIEKNF
ncbi:MAG: GDSL-type esterase/lipase family protein [Bacteroidales bacterium]